MRISTSMQYRNHLSYLQTANSRVDQASMQYNTGKLFQTAGENPGSMSASMKYESDIASYKQYGLNAKIVADALSQEETALGQIYETMSSIQTRLIQAVNGTLDDGSRAALAEDIKQAQAQLFNTMNTKNAEGEYIFSGTRLIQAVNGTLDDGSRAALAEDIKQAQAQLFNTMNTKNAEGEYIFSGAQSTMPTFKLTSDGKYVCQADGSSKNVNVSPNLTVQTTDSGLNIFENVHLAADFSSTTAAGNNTYQSSISDYDQFNALYSKYFNKGVDGKPAANADNTLTIEVGAGNTFELKDSKGNVIDSGEVKDGKIIVQGMEFEVPGGTPAQGDKINVLLDKPRSDNILNQLTHIIDALNKPIDTANPADVTALRAQLTRDIVKMQENLNISKKQVDTYRGLVGARGANIEDIIKSNESLHDIKKEANANVSEIDAFEAVSNLLVTQNALQVAQQSYNIVHSTSLFDFMR